MCTYTGLIVKCIHFLPKLAIITPMPPSTDNESNLGCGLFLVHSVIQSGNINDMHSLKILKCF